MEEREVEGGEMISNSFSLDSEHIIHLGELLSDPSRIDLVVFGDDNVITHYKAGHLKEIFVSDKSKYKDDIVKQNCKTRINIMKTNEFILKYGELVGIRYFTTMYDANEDEYENIELI